jgi:4-methyl-5(b-hydroxyethyl)-thiazole monophosphate biosynthesis
MGSKVLVAVADGSEETEAVTIIDTLRRAGAEVTVASVNGRIVTASRGVRIEADCLIAECVKRTWDLVVLPGGMPGAERLRDSAELTAILKEQAGAGRAYAAICAAPAVVLDHHGLLKGRRATCYPSFSFKEGAVSEERVVVDGNCATSRGPGTALEFSLRLAEMLAGRAKADEVGKGMLAVR